MNKIILSICALALFTGIANAQCNITGVPLSPIPTTVFHPPVHHPLIPTLTQLPLKIGNLSLFKWGAIGLGALTLSTILLYTMRTKLLFKKTGQHI